DQTVAQAQHESQASAEERDAPEAAAGEPLAGKFLLFNAIPSWMVSGVVHFVALLILAVMTVDAKLPETTLSINAPPVQKLEESEELKDEKIELKIDSTVVSDQREIVQQALQDVVDPTSTPTVAVDVDAAAVQVELSDFGQQTAPKNDLMATVGALTGSGL